MKKETKHIIRTLGTILFILYVLALIYFLFFSEEYGRVAMEERQYRYNLMPFVEIRRFWVYRRQLGLLGGIYQFVWKCGRISAFRVYAADDRETDEKRIVDHFIWICSQLLQWR
ncbi:MAG: VanZ family protein [Blautia wexlerae]